ncbi:mitochondrial small ribosomal subunit Rsm22-domain-containing protein [Amylocystis lapponica]|nr:mitochondrial small ribosomal subunit Rsm22-domain-containing protein [Amylocystis lapponica]
MLRTSCRRSLGGILRRPAEVSAFSSTSIVSSHQPNAPLDLDPSFQVLLKDVDISMLRQKSRHPTAENPHARALRELEVFPSDAASEEEARKSPAALFGSQRIGAVVLPFELQQTITRLIAESDKPALHADASRLFGQEDDAEWDTSYDVKYKSRRQAARHAERDGTAFASVALPSHYSAISAVLDHVKQRMGPEWKVERVIDWGSGTGSGLWASSYAFQKEAAPRSPTEASVEVEDVELSRSTVSTYLGIDKRDGLARMGRRLVKDVKLGGLSISWQKSFQETDRIQRTEGGDVLALSAFMLSSLPTPLARKALVKEMWESGAGTMVLIDHNTTAGFEYIAEARDYLLRLGRKEVEDPETEGWPIRGSHVVAPCPHDGACPLYHPGSSTLICGFSQRLQRPAFVRKTKHSGAGHEDAGYSYVVIRRGTRPIPVSTGSGRIGEVGKRELDKIAQDEAPIMELVVDGEEHPSASADSSPTNVTTTTASGADYAVDVDSSATAINKEELESALRLEAYSWPRLVFPPMKRPGHIILDGCTAEGKIMRMTIPKSQGKQPYYDARKSGWGDIFPHEPKNPPQERYQPVRAKAKTVPLSGEHIGKRPQPKSSKEASYGKLSDELKKQKRRERQLRLREKLPNVDSDR